MHRMYSRAANSMLISLPVQQSIRSKINRCLTLIEHKRNLGASVLDAFPLMMDHPLCVFRAPEVITDCYKMSPDSLHVTLRHTWHAHVTRHKSHRRSLNSEKQQQQSVDKICRLTDWLEMKPFWDLPSEHFFIESCVTGLWLAADRKSKWWLTLCLIISSLSSELYFQAT